MTMIFENLATCKPAIRLTYDRHKEGDLEIRTTKDSSKTCELLPESSDAPLPVILMALGRSGSSITWDVMSHLTGGRSIAYVSVKEDTLAYLFISLDCIKHLNSYVHFNFAGGNGCNKRWKQGVL